MDTKPSAAAVKMRKFNRFYTNLLGLLDKHLPDTEFSLTEARILYEIGTAGEIPAKDLTQKLTADPGYLSRILKSFEKRGLIRRVRSEEDGRLHPVCLTERGRETLARMNAVSDRQAENLLGGLSAARREKLVTAMAYLQSCLSGEGGPPVEIRCGLRPGDSGTLIRMHGRIYAEECSYDRVFEGYVCKTFFDFLTNYNPEKDRIWFAEAGGETVGAIAVAAREDNRCQLRWFITDPDYRGRGLGGRLMSEALSYARSAGFSKIYLETTDDQKTAVAMYLKAGFKLVREYEAEAWGVRHMEQDYEMDLV